MIFIRVDPKREHPGKPGTDHCASYSADTSVKADFMNVVFRENVLLGDQGHSSFKCLNRCDLSWRATGFLQNVLIARRRGETTGPILKRFLKAAAAVLFLFSGQGFS
jgi:hypothetical protein